MDLNELKGRVMSNRWAQKLIVGAAAVTGYVSTVKADGTLAENLANYSTVITSASDWFNDVLSIFTQVPMNIFVGIGIFGLVLRYGKKLIRTR